MGLEESIKASFKMASARAQSEGSLIDAAKAAMGLSNDGSDNRLWVEGLMMHLDQPLPATVTVPPEHPLYGKPLRLLVRSGDAAAKLSTMIMQPVDMRWDATGHEREKLSKSNGIRGSIATAEIRNGNELWVALCFWKKEFPEEALFLLDNLSKIGMSVDMGTGSVELSPDFPNTAVFSDPIFYGGTILFRALAADKGSRIGAIAGSLPYHDLPLAMRDHPWDAGAARQRLETWSRSIGAPNEKYKEAFLWVNSSMPEDFGSYKLPYADVIEGSLMAIPRAIFAAAARLDQTGIPEDDKEKVKSVLSHWYERMRSEFKDEQLKAPWEQHAAASDDSTIQRDQIPAEVTSAHKEINSMEIEAILEKVTAGSKELADSLRAELTKKDAQIAELQSGLTGAVAASTDQIKATIERDLRAAFDAEKSQAVAEVTTKLTEETTKAANLAEQVAETRKIVDELKSAVSQAQEELAAAKAEIEKRDTAERQSKVLAERLTVLEGIAPFKDGDLTDEVKTLIATASDESFETIKLRREIEALKSGKTDSAQGEATGRELSASAHAALHGTANSGISDFAKAVDAFCVDLLRTDLVTK